MPLPGPVGARRVVELRGIVGAVSATTGSVGAPSQPVALVEDEHLAAPASRSATRSRGR
jgi:hypothetical protein